jgi:hypothetical protein
MRKLKDCASQNYTRRNLLLTLANTKKCDHIQNFLDQNARDFEQADDVLHRCASPPPNFLLPNFKRQPVNLISVLPENFSSKLGAWDPVKGWVPMTYKDCYVKQSISGVNRILIATSSSSMDLMSQLLGFYPGPYRLAYLLVTPPEGFQPMKYEVEGLGEEDVKKFIESYRSFLEGDARHHIWIHSSTGGGTLICDEHDWVYAYGAQESISTFLNFHNFAQEMPEIPFPHLHNESSANDGVMRDLLGHFDWKEHSVSNLG